MLKRVENQGGVHRVDPDTKSGSPNLCHTIYVELWMNFRHYWKNSRMEFH